MSSCKSHKVYCYLANLITNSLFGTYTILPLKITKKGGDQVCFDISNKFWANFKYHFLFYNSKNIKVLLALQL
jgi:hypothetical protein